MAYASGQCACAVPGTPLTGVVNIASVNAVFYAPAKAGASRTHFPCPSGMFNVRPQSMGLVEHPMVPVVYLRLNVVRKALRLINWA